MHKQVIVNHGAAADELDQYLLDSRVTTEDPLAWWLANSAVYPTLWRMARDMHIVPGMSPLSFIYSMLMLLSATSVSVERSFSRGRILLSHLRNRLRANTVRALMSFGDWCRQDLVDDADMVEVIRGGVDTSGPLPPLDDLDDDDGVDDGLLELD